MYKHVRVSLIIKETQKAIDAAAKKPNPEPGAWVLLPEGFYVHPNLADLCAAVRKFMPKCKFGAPDNDISKFHKYTWDGDVCITRYGMVSVYYPDELYSMGEISYTAHSNNSDVGPRYGVCSRVISNGKYRRDTVGYNMKTSERMDVIVREAKANLRAYRVHEIADIHRGFKEHVKEIANNKGKLKGTKEYKVTSSGSSLFKEIRTLVESGYTFVDPNFHQECLAWIQVTDDLEAERARQVPAVFITVTMNRGEQTFDAIVIDDIKKEGMLYKDMPCQRYTDKDLPEEYMGKLSVLSLLGVGQYTPGVGKRVEETCFWLEF